MRTLAGQIVFGALTGLLCGVASAVFLVALDAVTGFRASHGWLPFWLPLAGVAIGLVYERYGQSVKRGTGLILDRARDGGDQVPARMVPMVLLGTLATHLFGGSAGREGTAVQMGAAMADAISFRFKLKHGLRRQLLLAGVAGGFGSVFGTPVAGALFALEFVVPWKWQWRSAVPVVIASLVGDRVTRLLGVEHTAYPRVGSLAPSLVLLGKWTIFAIAVLLVTLAFIELSHAIKSLEKRARLPVRMFVGGLAVVLLWQALGTDDHLGLGVPTIVRAFGDPSVPTWSFAAKLLLTAITVGVGFIGGEVTPLFFIGATLGNALASWLGLPLDLAAAVGMAAVFGVAANAPIALAVMAVELVGWSVFPHVLFVSVLAHVLNHRRRSIYQSASVR
ncbi:MAG: chloride channel protein [Archangium sp.]